MPTTPPPHRRASEPDIDLAWTEEDVALDDLEYEPTRASDRVTVAPPMPPEEYTAAILASARLGDTRREGRRRSAPRVTPVRAGDKAAEAGIRTPVVRMTPPAGDAIVRTPLAAPVPVVTPPALSLDFTTESVMPPSLYDADAPQNPALALTLPEPGGALELVSVRVLRTSPAPGDPLRAVRDHFEVGDFSGALALVDAYLETDPTNVDAIAYATQCRDALTKMYLSRLGGPAAVPRSAVDAEEVKWLSLDHRAGFLLSLCDGRLTIDEILDASSSSMSRVEALRVLSELVRENVLNVG